MINSSWKCLKGLPSLRDSIRQPLHVTEGEDALVTCVVRNLGTNTVLWKREDPERRASRVLTAGDNRVTSDTRFNVLHDSGKTNEVIEALNLLLLLITFERIDKIAQLSWIYAHLITHLNGLQNASSCFGVVTMCVNLQHLRYRELSHQVLTPTGSNPDVAISFILIVSYRRVIPVWFDLGGDVWVLVIKAARSSDSGTYICEINSNPILRSFHSIFGINHQHFYSARKY